MIGKILEKLREAVTGDSYECPACGYEPKIAVDGFDITGGGSGAATGYRCPECGHRFEALLCRCGNGYSSLSEFDEKRERSDGVTEYVCSCGSTLHRDY